MNTDRNLSPSGIWVRSNSWMYSVSISENVPFSNSWWCSWQSGSGFRLSADMRAGKPLSRRPVLPSMLVTVPPPSLVVHFLASLRTWWIWTLSLLQPSTIWLPRWRREECFCSSASRSKPAPEESGHLLAAAVIFPIDGRAVFRLLGMSTAISSP